MLLFVPQIGTRMAELIEIPIMIIVIIVAAKWIVRHYSVPFTPLSRLGTGLIALSLFLIAEFTLVLWLRGMSISEYFATRDPVSGIVYYLSLVVFGIMPVFVRRR